MTSPPWNEPKQARSRQRFDALLDSAAALFVERGIDAVTTNHIAEAADIPIGSLYQFFPSKEALLAALIDRHLKRMSSVFPTTFAADATFETTVQAIVDGLMRYDALHPEFGQLFGALDTPGHRHLLEPMQAVVTGSIAVMLGAFFPRMSVPLRERCALTGFGIVRGLVGMTGLSTDDVALETRTALIGYVRALLAREGLS